MRIIGNFFESLPIQRKISLVILVTCGTALLVAAVGIFGAAWATFRQNFTSDLEASGRVLASSSTAAVAFKDAKAAREMLSALQAKPWIVQAWIELPNHSRLAGFGPQKALAGPNAPRTDGTHSAGPYLVLNQPIVLQGERLGTLHLVADYAAESRTSVQVYGVVLVGVLLVATILTLLLSERLQRLISAPILALAGAAQTVADEKDYTIRAQKVSPDEVGRLTDAFNHMLETIQHHDTALRRANVDLEREIEDRKRTEADLAYQRDLFRVLMDNLPDRIYFKDLESRFVCLSRAKLESSLDLVRCRYRQETGGKENFPPHLSGLESFGNFLVGKTDFDVFDEERARQAFEDEQKILKTGEPVIGKFERTDYADGKVSWILTTKMPWRDSGGRLLGTFGVSRDITPVKDAEAQVEALNRQLTLASRHAGMAEVATGVLHNVGNVLNSVNVSLNCMHDQLNHSEVVSLDKAAALLQAHAADQTAFITKDPKGKLLPKFIIQLAQQLSREHHLLQQEHAQLARGIDHIKEIVAMQQNYASVSGVLEKVPVVNLIEDALRLHRAGLERHGVQIVRRFSEVPTLTVDKHKVLQILVNLVHNAKYALDEASRPDKQLTVGIRLNGVGRVKITVADNGIGIPPENLTRIFSHGFTTRKGGHGFGLHSGANAAKEMGGVLSVHSDGPGKGAIFSLELPVGNERVKA